MLRIMSTPPMTVDLFAQRLRDPRLTIEKIGSYTNRSGLDGCRADIFLDGVWYQYSVHNTESNVSPVQVAAAITSAERIVAREEFTRDGRQYDATVWSGGRAYMLVTTVDRPAPKRATIIARPIQEERKTE